MGGVSRSIRKVARKVTKPIAQVAAATPVVKDVLKVANDPLRAVKPGKMLAQQARPDTFAGAPKEVVSAAADQAKQTIMETAGTPLGAVKPKATVGYDSEMAADSAQTRRRRARGIATGSRGVTGQARVSRKTLLGE